MKFNVLKPIFTPYMDFFTVRWQVIGQASSMAEAKKLYGGAPVLESIK